MDKNFQLLDAIVDVGAPATTQFFQSAHVQVAVVEESFQFLHLTGQKTSVLANAVAAHRRLSRFEKTAEELQGLAFGARIVVLAAADPVDQT